MIKYNKTAKTLWCINATVWFCVLAAHALNWQEQKEMLQLASFIDDQVESYDSSKTKPHVPRPNILDGTAMTLEQANSVLDIWEGETVSAPVELTFPNGEKW